MSTAMSTPMSTLMPTSPAPTSHDNMAMYESLDESQQPHIREVTPNYYSLQANEGNHPTHGESPYTNVPIHPTDGGYLYMQPMRPTYANINTTGSS